MEKDLSAYRKSYLKKELHKSEISENPIDLFEKWFQEAESSHDIEEANAMTLSTIGSDGFPKSRVVLLKKITSKGFVFFTNYNSEKGKAIAQNPQVCISFFWQNSERQIIVKGTAEKISEQHSEAYFNSRPEGSKLGAWASEQSSVISDRKVLDQSLEAFKKKYNERPIPRPKHWGGYEIEPASIEFWQGRANRLHDRIRYTRLKNKPWKIERLAP